MEKKKHSTGIIEQQDMWSISCKGNHDIIHNHNAYYHDYQVIRNTAYYHDWLNFYSDSSILKILTEDVVPKFGTPCAYIHTSHNVFKHKNIMITKSYSSIKISSYQVSKQEN